MNRKPLDNDDSWEDDAVWKLLDQAPRTIAGGRFADDTVRAARLAGQPAAWWASILRPLPIASLAAATAAVAIAITSWNHQVRQPDPGVAVSHSHADEIADIAETEALIAAVEDIDEFSDHELVSLIGF